MSAVMSTPEARACSRRASSRPPCPQLLRIASLVCEICTGSFASRPIWMISSIAFQK